MALVAYLTGGDPNTPDPSGNTYAVQADIDTRLFRFKAWTTLDDAEKEGWILGVVALMNDETFDGAVLSQTQPLPFPRNFGILDIFIEQVNSPFSLEQQPKHLLKAVIAQLQFWLTSIGQGLPPGPGVANYSIGDESFSGIRQDVGLCREAKGLIMRYKRK